jgi:uncharacterized membrane protein YhaH (DUF805 family)
VKKPKEGIENFIIKKLEKAHSIDEIYVILEGAGFSKAEIDTGIRNVKKTHKTLHQDVVASNNFLPPLKKQDKLVSSSRVDERNIKHIGLFAGRMRRKDFTVSVLFLFSLFFTFVIVMASFIDELYPETWKVIGKMMANDTNGILYLYLPVLFAPFTLFFLSLVTRRLHDLGLAGILSFLYLCVFIYPFSVYVPKGIIVFDIVLFILFLFLLSKSGAPEKNKYGQSPVGHGSTFTKILNLK